MVRRVLVGDKKNETSRNNLCGAGDGGGMRMTADARATLMQRLSGQALPGPPAFPGALPGPPPGMVPAQQARTPALPCIAASTARLAA